jgi:ATP-dependent Clp protease ATP-binding subunit ClpC
MKNPFSSLTKNARSAFRLSTVMAKRMGAREVEPVHLFLALLLTKEGVASRMFRAMNVDIEQTVAAFTGGMVMAPKEVQLLDKSFSMSDEVKEVINRAYGLARTNSHVYVGTEHLLVALLQDAEQGFVKELVSSGIKVEEIKKNMFNFATYPPGVLSKAPRSEDENAPSVLDMLGVDLTDMAAKGLLDPLVGREEELAQMINILSRRRKNNPIVVGEAGVGKTALVEGLAQKVVNGEVPESLKDMRIISLDVAGIVAGSKMRGDMEEKMMAVINEVTSSPRTALFIDEIHTILGMGAAGGGGLDLAGVLKPALVHGGFKCIGATTLVDYTRFFDEDPALSRRFQQVLVEEASVDDTIKILKQVRPLLEAHHHVVIVDEALDSAVRLSDQYISDRYLPDKAIDLMDEACAVRRIEVEDKSDDLNKALAEYQRIKAEKESTLKEGNLEHAASLRKQEVEQKLLVTDLRKKQGKVKRSKRYWVDADLVRKLVSRWTGIPISTIGESESSELIKLDETLGHSVVGQDEAVKKVADAIKRARTGVTSGERPWASFLFLGPTGVGKSELAKILTKVLFGDEDRLIQIDMSEMMEMHSVSKLIGSPPGYVGYREGGQLTERVRQQPHAVILFDEIEKAHIDVLNILLQILEYGHLTDGKGRRVNFKNTVVILTSNIGAEEIRRDKVLGFDVSAEKKERTDREIEHAYYGMKEVLESELKDALPPELLNRLDDIVIFRSLTRRDARKIVDLLLDELNERLKDKRIAVDLNPAAKEFIVERGFSEEYGARPLRRTIQEYVETPVASYLLKYGGGVVSKGKDVRMRTKRLNVVKARGFDKLIVTKGS